MNLDLQRAIHSYQNELWPRHRVKNAVCDAIEVFCAATCITHFWALPFDVRVRDSRSRYITSCDCIGEHFLLRGNDPCRNCGKRIVETFDILKEDGGVR